MKTDMYYPPSGAHYLASASQIPILERSGWVVYADWLAAQSSTTTTSSTTSTDTTSTDTSSSTTPAPTL